MGSTFNFAFVDVKDQIFNCVTIKTTNLQFEYFGSNNKPSPYPY